MVILRMSDTVPLKIGPITFQIGPLAHQQKTEILEQVKLDAGEAHQNSFSMAALALKYSIKDISGVTTTDGDDYKLSFDDSGNLTEECVSEIMGLGNSTLLMRYLSTVIGGIKESEVEGVEVVLPETKVKNAVRQAGAR